MITFFATLDEHDSPIRCSRWVALQTLERLKSELGIAADLIEEERANREGLEQALTSSRGLAFFGHGSPNALFDKNRSAVLDRANIHIANTRWIYAFACRAGEELAGEAIAAGASCFVGYESILVLEWDPKEIPEPILAAFTELVTQTTIELARGIRDVKSLRRAALSIQGDVISWCDEHPEEAHGLEITAQQLLRRLIVRTTEPSASALDHWQ